MHRKSASLIILVTAAGMLLSCSRTLVLVRPEAAIPTKKAILVLPGLRNSGKGHRDAKRWYAAQGYDAFIPEYVSKEGFDGSVANLHAFIKEHHLDEYAEVNAFVYLLGGWTLNKYLEKYPMPNLKKIVYDRSPYQEQAPRIVLNNFPRIIHLVFGCAVDQLRDTPYPTLEKETRHIGIMVETRTTPFIRRHRDELKPIPDTAWLPDAFRQPHDDLMYVHLHHDEMYYNYNTIGDELLSFFRTGRFTDSASRTRSPKDPFE